MRHRLAPLAVTLAVEVAAVSALAALRGHPDVSVDWGDLAGWARITPPEAALAAVAFHAAAVATCWVLLSTIGYLLVRVMRLSAAASIVGAATLPVARRAVDRAVLVVATSVALAVPGAAVGQEPIHVTPPGTESIGYGPANSPRQPPTDAPAEQIETDEYVVRRGDSFWRIAANRVAPPGDVARYWVRLVAANRESIRSGDPDLIYPGERITLPPLEETT